MIGLLFCVCYIWLRVLLILEISMSVIINNDKMLMVFICDVLFIKLVMYLCIMLLVVGIKLLNIKCFSLLCMEVKVGNVDIMVNVIMIKGIKDKRVI